MFEFSIFNNDISNWNVFNVTFKLDMFQNCPIEKNINQSFKNENIAKLYNRKDTY